MTPDCIVHCWIDHIGILRYLLGYALGDMYGHKSCVAHQSIHKWYNHRSKDTQLVPTSGMQAQSHAYTSSEYVGEGLTTQTTMHDAPVL